MSRVQYMFDQIPHHQAQIPSSYDPKSDWITSTWRAPKYLLEAFPEREREERPSTIYYSATGEKKELVLSARTSRRAGEEFQLPPVSGVKSGKRREEFERNSQPVHWAMSDNQQGILGSGTPFKAADEFFAPPGQTQATGSSTAPGSGLPNPIYGMASAGPYGLPSSISRAARNESVPRQNFGSSGMHGRNDGAADTGRRNSQHPDQERDDQEEQDNQRRWQRAPSAAAANPDDPSDDGSDSDSSQSGRRPPRRGQPGRRPNRPPHRSPPGGGGGGGGDGGGGSDPDEPGAQAFRQEGHEKESPQSFIGRRIKYVRMLANTDDGGPLEVFLVMKKAPIRWSTILVLENIHSIEELYDKVRTELDWKRNGHFVQDTRTNKWGRKVTVEEIEDESLIEDQQRNYARRYVIGDPNLPEDDKISLDYSPPKERKPIVLQTRRAHKSGESSLGVSVLSIRGWVGSDKDEETDLRLDSCADISLISYELYSCLKNKPPLKQGKAMKLAQLTDTGTKIQGYTRVRILVTSEDGQLLETEAEVYVVKGMSVPILLGEDYQLNYEIAVERDVKRGNMIAYRGTPYQKSGSALYCNRATGTHQTTSISKETQKC
ncbi:hypothetical protein GGX14DRAFT_392334 [Mycena pura]|uniref:Uncharacterized protein n=1 Tax=Mycena pura TaxID=153505 RepID=A0AAD6VJZ7_9AGAR|nr:hypothetical protein GGX14DRAFT_392334 [Mycena pura]